MRSRNEPPHSKLRGILTNVVNLTAFGVATTAAEEAALLIDQQIAAVRALAGNIPDNRRLHDRPVRTLLDFLLQNTGNGIRTGQDGMSALPGNRRTAKAAQMLDNGVHLDS